MGSESRESLLKDEITLIEDLPSYNGIFAKWFKHDPNILKLVQAPVLVSTIDYLMPANEGIRGGRQIAQVCCAWFDEFKRPQSALVTGSK